MHRSLSAVLIGAWTLCLTGVMPAPSRADLLTFGYSNARTGSAPSSHLSVRSAAKLRVAWRTQLDGPINTQPLVIHGVRTREGVRKLVVVGTEHGEVAALNARTGRVLWRHRVAVRRITPDCAASPDGRFGVTGTPVVDRRAGRVYVVDVAGEVWALRLATGRTVPGWPVRIVGQSAAFVWGGLSLFHGWLYVPVASLCDGGHYRGGVVAVRVRHPARIARWYAVPAGRDYGGGVWGWGGVSIDGGGRVYAATSNSLGPDGESVGHAESVVQLRAGLRLLQADDPLRPPFGTSDRDFGTTPVLIRRSGCPPQLVAINKDGELFLYDRDHVSAGPRQRLQVGRDATYVIPLIGLPAFSVASDTLVLEKPSRPPGSSVGPGVVAYRLLADCRLAFDWHQTFDPPDSGSAPMIAGHVVFIGSGRDGWLRAFSLTSGRRVGSWHLSKQAIFAAPAVDGSTVYEAAWSGRVWALRPRG